MLGCSGRFLNAAWFRGSAASFGSGSLIIEKVLGGGLRVARLSPAEEKPMGRTAERRAVDAFRVGVGHAPILSNDAEAWEAHAGNLIVWAAAMWEPERTEELHDLMCAIQGVVEPIGGDVGIKMVLDGCDQLLSGSCNRATIICAMVATQGFQIPVGLVSMRVWKK